MEPRIENPAALFPAALQALMTLHGVVDKSGLPATISALTHLRISQINGCSVCVDIGWRQLRQAGESDARLFTVAAWREAPYFTDAERAALALAEALTRVADRPDPVPDAIWDEAVRHFSQKQLAALTLSIGVTNIFNRMNIATRQIAGEWTQSIVQPRRAEERAVAV